MKEGRALTRTFIQAGLHVQAKQKHIVQVASNHMGGLHCSSPVEPVTMAIAVCTWAQAIMGIFELDTKWIIFCPTCQPVRSMCHHLAPLPERPFYPLLSLLLDNYPGILQPEALQSMPKQAIIALQLPVCAQNSWFEVEEHQLLHDLCGLMQIPARHCRMRFAKRKPATC